MNFFTRAQAATTTAELEQIAAEYLEWSWGAERRTSDPVVANGRGGWVVSFETVQVTITADNSFVVSPRA